MSSGIREQLSAMADGEIEAQGARFLLKRLDHDAEFRGVWERYHLIRDCLRRQNGSMAPIDFCSRVSAQINQADRRNFRLQGVRRSLRTFAAGAIAAGVAAVTLYAARVGPPGTEHNLANAHVPHVADMTTRDLVPPHTMASVGAQERFVIIQQPVASELDAYFVRHGEAAGSVGSLGVIPSIRAVTVSSTTAIDLE